MDVTKRQAFAAIAGVLLVTCIAVPLCTGRDVGDAGEARTVPGAATTGGAGAGGVDVGVLHTGVSGGGSAAQGGAGTERGPGGAATKRPVPVYGLGLRVGIVDTDAQVGEPVRARVQIENRGKTPVTLCDPLLDLPRRIELLYRYRNVNYCAKLAAGPMQPLDTSKLMELQPGRAVEVVVDLRPLFDSCRGFGEGPFQFRLAYRGAPDAFPAVVRAWNGDPGQVATSDDLVFHAPVPAWFEEIGGDGDLLNSLASRIEIWAPGSPEDQAVLEHVRSLGQPAVAALAIVAGRIGSPEPNAPIRARKSLVMLRHLGPDAIAVLRRVPASPAVDIAIGVIEEDERERAGAGPSDASKPFRAIGGGAQGTSFVVSFMRPEVTGSISYTFDAAGAIYVTRWETRERKVIVAPPLTTDQVAEVKRTILRARPWTWRPVRVVGHVGEGEAGFALADHGGATLWLQSFRGDEARDGNPFSADVLRAFRIAAGDDKVPVAAQPAPPAPATLHEGPKR